MSIDKIGKKLDALAQKEKELNRYYYDPGNFTQKTQFMFHEMRRDYLEDLDTYGFSRFSWKPRFDFKQDMHLFHSDDGNSPEENVVGKEASTALSFYDKIASRNINSGVDANSAKKMSLVKMSHLSMGKMLESVSKKKAKPEIKLVHTKSMGFALNLERFDDDGLKKQRKRVRELNRLRRASENKLWKNTKKFDKDREIVRNSPALIELRFENGPTQEFIDSTKIDNEFIKSVIIPNSVRESTVSFKPTTNNNPKKLFLSHGSDFYQSTFQEAKKFLLLKETEGENQILTDNKDEYNRILDEKESDLNYDLKEEVEEEKEHYQSKSYTTKKIENRRYETKSAHYETHNPQIKKKIIVSSVKLKQIQIPKTLALKLKSGLEPYLNSLKTYRDFILGSPEFNPEELLSYDFIQVLPTQVSRIDVLLLSIQTPVLAEMVNLSVKENVILDENGENLTIEIIINSFKQNLRNDREFKGQRSSLLKPLIYLLVHNEIYLAYLAALIKSNTLQVVDSGCKKLLLERFIFDGESGFALNLEYLDQIKEFYMKAILTNDPGKILSTDDLADTAAKIVSTFQKFPSAFKDQLEKLNKPIYIEDSAGKKMRYMLSPLFIKILENIEEPLPSYRGEKEKGLDRGRPSTALIDREAPTSNHSNKEKVSTTTWRISPSYIRPKSAVNFIEKNKFGLNKRRISPKRVMTLTSPDLNLNQDGITGSILISSDIPFPSLQSSVMESPEVHIKSKNNRGHSALGNSLQFGRDIVTFKEIGLRASTVKQAATNSDISINERQVFRSRNYKYEFKKSIPSKEIRIKGASFFKKA